MAFGVSSGSYGRNFLFSGELAFPVETCRSPPPSFPRPASPPWAPPVPPPPGSPPPYPPPPSPMPSPSPPPPSPPPLPPGSTEVWTVTVVADHDINSVDFDAQAQLTYELNVAFSVGHGISLPNITLSISGHALSYLIPSSGDDYTTVTSVIRTSSVSHANSVRAQLVSAISSSATTG
eukprot:1625144-Prymnesium_polylepis.1